MNRDDRRWLGLAAGVLSTLAAVDQLVAIALRDPGAAFWVTALTLALGVPLLVAVQRLYAHRQRRIPVPLLPAVALLVAAVGAGAAAGYLGTRALGGTQPTRVSTTAGGATPATAIAPPAQSIPPSLQTLPMHTETTDNHRGTPVFRDPEGNVPDSSTPQLIPFDTQIGVYCWTENLSGMGTINAFYLLGTGRWAGLYAPANTFANGDPLGAPGAGTQLDPAVKHCPAA